MAGSRKGARIRAVAAEAVDAVVSSGRSLDDALAALEHRIPADDRPLIRMLCYGCLRHHWSLQAWVDELLDRPLKKRDSVIRALLAVGLFQLTKTRVPDHAAVSQTVEAARLLRRPKYAGLLNAILRRFMREQMSERPAADDPARYDHPQWLIDAIRSDWPVDWDPMLTANNERAPMWLRVNRRKSTVEVYQQRLAAAGIDAHAAPGLGQALRLAKPLPATELPGFADGVVSVQDAGAQIAALWLLESGGGRLLDACAAPGGKSAHLLELAAEDALLTCIDIDADRLMRVAENLSRVGLSATVLVGDASNPDDWWDKKPFDGILLDAPCSASGVIRRHPDIKLLRRASDIAELARRQAQILRALWALLAPGGRLLYVTCSVLAAENDAVVSGFLEENNDARENTMLQNNNIRDVMRQKACGYQVLPGTAGMDGFYYACLEKVA